MDASLQRLAELEALCAAQAVEIENLKQLIASLTARLARRSHNSHLPPSSDGPGARPGQGPAGANKKRGGQPGHRGHKRALAPVERVDQFIELYPCACQACWSPLPATPDPSASRYQVTELAPVMAHITEYRRHQVSCACGASTRGPVQGSVPASAFGPRLTSLLALLTGVYHLSRRQTVALLEDVLGVRLSLGALSAAEERVSQALEPVLHELQAELEAAPVKHVDSTSWLEAGQSRSLWTLASPRATLFRVCVDGTAASLRPLLGACEGILVSDRAAVFSCWDMSRRQICWAHLKRKFTAFVERGGLAKRFGSELLAYTSLVFRYWRDYRARKLEKSEYQRWMASLSAPLAHCLQRAAAAALPEVSGSCLDILAHQAALWTFVEHDGVEPTNNHAERELRDGVLWRKGSFGSQSARGNRFAERLMSIAHTARKQQKNVFAYLIACCQAAMSQSTAPPLLSQPLAV